MPQGSMLELVYLNIFINGREGEVNNTLITSQDDTKQHNSLDRAQRRNLQSKDYPWKAASFLLSRSMDKFWTMGEGLLWGKGSRRGAQAQNVK